jgi:hypothetical protein
MEFFPQIMLLITKQLFGLPVIRRNRQVVENKLVKVIEGKNG